MYGTVLDVSSPEFRLKTLDLKGAGGREVVAVVGGALGCGMNSQIGKVTHFERERTNQNKYKEMGFSFIYLSVPPDYQQLPTKAPH